MSVASGDPSNTKTLRERQYRPDLTTRFDAVVRVLRETIGRNDALGLNESDLSDLSASLAEYDPEKFKPADHFSGGDLARRDAFVNRLDYWLSEGVLEQMDPQDINVGKHFTGKYVRAAASKGEGFAVSQLEQDGIDVPRTGDEAVASALDRPVRVQLLSRLYQRNYDYLEGITSDVSDDIADELAKGAFRGENPLEVAAKLNGRVKGIGRWRAEVLARTETLYAHNSTAVEVYDQWYDKDRELGYSIEGSNSNPNAAGSEQMEHITAGDSRVCAECRALEGRTMTIREVKNNPGEYMPPVCTHAQCRCTVVLA